MNSQPALLAQRRRRSRAGLLFLLFVAMVISGYYLEERIRGKTAWEKYEAEARQRGVKLHFADFIPAEIPDRENFASIPIFEAAMRAEDQGSEMPNPFILSGEKVGNRPTRSDASKQRYINLVEWQKYFLELGLLSTAGESPAKDVLKAIDAFEPSLAQVREAEARPHCRFPVPWAKDPLTTLGHYDLIRDAARFEVFRMCAHLELGESPAAYEDFRHGFRLCTAIVKEPTLISGLMRISLAMLVQNAVWSGLAKHQWAEPELRKIEADLGEVDWSEDYLFSISSERAATNDILDAFIRDWRRFPFLPAMEAQDPKVKDSVGFFWFFPTGWKYQNKLRLNRYYDELLARAAPAQHRWFGERPTPSSPHNLGNAAKFPNLLCWLMASVYSDMETSWAHTAAFSDEARIACALERFRLARGQFPDALQELAPEFIAALPPDIASGEPYHYRRTPEGSFILYSVGANQRDDGGKMDIKLPAREQPDWVWYYPVKP